MEKMIDSLRCPLEFSIEKRSTSRHAGCVGSNHLCGSIKHNLAGYITERLKSCQSGEKTKIVAMRAITDTRLFGDDFSIAEQVKRDDIAIRTRGGNASLTPGMLYKARLTYCFKQLAGSNLKYDDSIVIPKLLSKPVPSE